MTFWPLRSAEVVGVWSGGERVRLVLSAGCRRRVALVRDLMDYDGTGWLLAAVEI
ncbi:hypothetical protein [Nocardia salmonicida]|uniref:hypothetical protein n=1 Tax=Nocardia salmonicida TaxID=53431 RepID=UPI000A42A3CD|nr:hypothetical protein [Nocardia salmonicida]